MQAEISFGSFNTFNLALPGTITYDNLAPYTQAEYEAKINWTAQQIDKMDADVIGFQEVFSQAALRDVLARTSNYQQAHLVGFDPHADILTPSVALVSRLPVLEGTVEHIDFPLSILTQLAHGISAISRFTRPILHAQVAVSPQLTVHVFVLHLKSKRPDFLPAETAGNSYHIGIANLRSAIRRDTEALGLRYLLTDISQGKRMPLVVMGDFNDVIDAISTQLIMGVGRHGKADFEDRLFDCYRLQSQPDPLRDIGYSTVHDGCHQTIDHIMVSEQFHPHSCFSLGEVTSVQYLNDHLTKKPPEASDHGQVVARIKLNNAVPDGTSL
jgi:endonuclease/exonuclease/phosphatase family metal-dependent hydrolase